MLERTTISQPDRPPGILEHLSEGMSLVLAFPQLIAIPVLLDIYLLIGARISPAAMTTRLGDWLVGRNGANSVDAGEWVRGLGDWDMSRLLAFLMPSVMDGMKQDAIYRPFDRMAWSPSLPTAIATSLGLLLVGSFIFTAYLVLLASQADMIRTESRSTMRLIIDRWGKVLATTVVLTLVIGAISALFIVPGAVLSAGGIEHRHDCRVVRHGRLCRPGHHHVRAGVDRDRWVWPCRGNTGQRSRCLSVLLAISRFLCGLVAHFARAALNLGAHRR